MSRFLLLPLIAALGGCVTTSSGNDAAPGEKTATVILHTSLHDANCFGINMTLTQKDASGRWIAGQVLSVQGPLESAQMPSQILLSPGEYGIYNLYCQRTKRAYAARIVDKPTMFDRNRPIVLEKPIATFKVRPSEVVDIGSLSLPSGVARQDDGSVKRAFVGVVTPIPEAALRSLAEKDPALYRRRVVRPMVSATKI